MDPVRGGKGLHPIMTKRRWSVEFVGLLNSEPMWFDDEQEKDRFIQFIQSAPVDDGPVKLRVTEYGEVKSEIV